MLGEIWLIFALDPKLKLAAETLVFQSDQKFLCFVVQFHEKFWFLYQTRIVPEKVYARIWPVLEITSLKYQYSAWRVKVKLHTIDHLSGAGQGEGVFYT